MVDIYATMGAGVVYVALLAALTWAVYDSIVKVSTRR